MAGKTKPKPKSIPKPSPNMGQKNVNTAYPYTLSYTGRIVMLFALVAIMTALIAALVLAIVWEGHINNFAGQNMQHVANLTASQLSDYYEDHGGFDDGVESLQRVDTQSGVGIQAVDMDGNIIFGDLWISDEELSAADSPHLDETDIDQAKDGKTPDALSQNSSVEAPIMVENEQVGNVVVWAKGSSSFMTDQEKSYRNDSYGAIAFAAIVAVLMSCIIGYFVSRGIRNPLKRISKTADEIKGGNLSARTGLVGSDEISQLGMTFDDMAQSIENDRELEHRLTNDMAHELRTPLMAMQATIEAMVDGVLPVDNERLAMLDNEVVRLGKLVDALLKLSRLENRSTPMKAREVDLGAVIEELVLNHQMLVEDAELEFEYSYVPGIMVMADPDLIKQATANLLSNAVRYTDPGGKISIEVKRGTEMAEISVSDTGIGLSPEDLNHIFSRFWRADAGRDRASGGLGVGLAIVKEIVDRHNGWVNVESEVGAGSTFTINIPLIKEDPKKQAKKKQDKQGRITQRFRRKSNVKTDAKSGSANRRRNQRRDSSNDADDGDSDDSSADVERQGNEQQDSD